MQVCVLDGLGLDGEKAGAFLVVEFEREIRVADFAFGLLAGHAAFFDELADLRLVGDGRGGRVEPDVDDFLLAGRVDLDSFHGVRRERW